MGGIIFENNYDKTVFFGLMSVIALAASMSFAFLRTPTKIKVEMPQNVQGPITGDALIKASPLIRHRASFIEVVDDED